MQQALEIGCFLFIAHFQFAVVVHPRVRSFHDPAAGLALDSMPRLRRSLRWHMRNVSSVSHFLLRRLSGVAFIHAKVLWFPGGRFGPLHDDGVQRCPQQLHVMPIGPGDDKRERGATTVHQQAALGPLFFPDLSGCFPPPLVPVGLYPASHPSSATPTQSLPSRHILPVPLATTAQRILPPATVENAYGSHWRCRKLWARPSIGNLCATHTRWPRRDRAAQCTCAHRRAAAGICAAARHADRASAKAAQPLTKVYQILPRIGLSAWHKATLGRNIRSIIIYG